MTSTTLDNVDLARHRTPSVRVDGGPKQVVLGHAHTHLDTPELNGRDADVDQVGDTNRLK